VAFQCSLTFAPLLIREHSQERSGQYPLLCRASDYEEGRPGQEENGSQQDRWSVGPPETERYGFHSFRRFRTTYLRTEAAISDAYVTYWIGHGKRTITDGYTKIKQNTAKRRELCAQAGLEFKLPSEKVVAVDSKSKTKKVKAA
jgi:hypothetical protein